MPQVSSDQQKDLSILSAIFKKLDTDCDGLVIFKCVHGMT